MDKLIQTSIASIIYGEFQGKENQELFRCPRELDDKDLVRYINENRSLIGFEDDNSGDLRNIKGYKLKDYYRMYYRNGWAGRWMGFKNTGITQLDCLGVNKIIDWLCENFPNGCDYHMKTFMDMTFEKWGRENRYLFRPRYSDIYKIVVDTTYGNGDYPVRIYVYEKKGV